MNTDLFKRNGLCKSYDDNPVIDEYKSVSRDMIKLYYPMLSMDEIDLAIDWSISNRIKDTAIQVDNNYKHQTIDMTLLELAKYIYNRQPIITAYGVMYKRHGEVPNPIYNLVDGFINTRKLHKKEMFKYPKASEMFEKYNLLQALDKIDVNGYYGATGMFSCIYYNLYTACTTTAQGRSCISAAALFFESFLANNVPFGSMNELVTFIHDVIKEERHYDDAKILDENITFEECFYKLVTSTGWGWIPSDKELDIIWGMITQLGQEDINRLFYKNNLFHFIDNSFVKNAIIKFLCKLEKPYMDPNEIPEEAEEELNIIYDLMYEYLYYKEQIIDRLDKMNYLIRSVSIIQDTDSTIISLDGWYRYVLQFCDMVPMNIKVQVSELDKLIDGEEGATKPIEEPIMDYDFTNDQLIEEKRFVDPMVLIPQDGLKFSIINLISHIVGKLVNDYMERYCINSNSDSNGKCMIIMKNEFLFDRVLITDAKKHYGSKLKLQEGNIVPENGIADLDVKGMEAFTKSSMAEETRTRLKKILYEDILKSEDIDQIKVLKDIVMTEKSIYDSIMNGDKTFYKPVKIKSQSAYEDPMRIQGIKAACVYNALHETGTEAFDLTIRNSIDVVKVEMTPRNIDIIKDTHPEVYEKALELFKMREFNTGIDAIAIPINEPVPEWVKPFIRYATIINDNVSKFPLESIGLYRGNDNNNGTNIVSF